MKQSELIVLGLAGVAVWMIAQSQKKPASGGSVTRNAADYVGEIFSSTGKAFSNGWRYFENGVAIDPSGNYYRDGQMIWQAPGAGA